MRTDGSHGRALLAAQLARDLRIPPSERLNRAVSPEPRDDRAGMLARWRADAPERARKRVGVPAHRRAGAPAQKRKSAKNWAVGTLR